ncbi:hypothetical protein ALC60_01840 [Trachymyrmex zeteki]|uniref:Uncharacterized protein n=1 Tax=Mycetomoellerius zeteki TaxID=64791 RepID=A0A151XFT7_9HYME|nr:hypothetical protein ALC60_01840 [Trachymyrmex zeteki]
MRYGPAYRGARMQGRSNVFPGHAFDRHNGAPTIKLRTRRKFQIRFYFASNILRIVKYGYSSVLSLLHERIERQFFSINSRPDLAYPFEERSSWGLRQHSGVSTRFRCDNYKLVKMGFSLCKPVTEEEALLATRMNLRNNERSTRQNDLHYNQLCIRERRSMRSKRHYLCMRRNYNNLTICREQKRSQETQKHALGTEKWRRSLCAITIRVNAFPLFCYQRKGVDGARCSRGFTLFQHGAPSCRVIALVMNSVDNSSSPQDKSLTRTYILNVFSLYIVLFHIKPDFLVEYVALLVRLGFPHLSRSRRLLDTSDFTQSYIDRHSKPAKPVRSQSFISFSLRSGSLVL